MAHTGQSTLRTEYYGYEIQKELLLGFLYTVFVEDSAIGIHDAWKDREYGDGKSGQLVRIEETSIYRSFLNDDPAHIEEITIPFNLVIWAIPQNSSVVFLEFQMVTPYFEQFLKEYIDSKLGLSEVPSYTVIEIINEEVLDLSMFASIRVAGYKAHNLSKALRQRVQIEKLFRVFFCETCLEVGRYKDFSVLFTCPSLGKSQQTEIEHEIEKLSPIKKQYFSAMLREVKRKPWELFVGAKIYIAKLTAPFVSGAQLPIPIFSKDEHRKMVALARLLEEEYRRH